MKNLTSFRLKELLEYNPETGIFIWKQKVNRRIRVGSLAGTLSQGYWRISVDGHIYKSSKLAWLYMYGQWPIRCIDHKNGVPADDRIENLRDVSMSQNSQNRIAKGWYFSDNRYVSEIITPEHKIRLGRFKTQEEAHAAYIAAKRMLHPTALRYKENEKCK